MWVKGGLTRFEVKIYHITLIKPQNNSNKYVIKCPFDVITKDSIHAPSSLWYLTQILKLGRQKILQIFPLRFKINQIFDIT